MLAASGSGRAMALALSRALSDLWPQLLVSSWSGLCGKGGGQKSVSKTPYQVEGSEDRACGQGRQQGAETGGMEHQRQVGSNK